MKKAIATIIVTLFLTSMMFNVAPVAAGTDSWMIGDREPEAVYVGEIVDEFLVPGQSRFDDCLSGTQTFDYYVGVSALTDMPAGLADYSSVNIHFSISTPGYFGFYYSKFGSETDEIWFDGNLIDTFVGAGEGVFSEGLWEILIPDRNMHTITVKILGGLHWFDSFALELLQPSNKEIQLGMITHEDDISKVNAAVKYKMKDADHDGVLDTMAMEFQTVYFVKAKHKVQFLGYFMVDDLNLYGYTVKNVWGKISQPKRGGYDGTVVTDVSVFSHGAVWGSGTAPTGDSNDVMIQSDVDQPSVDGGDFAWLENNMKIVIHYTINVPLTYTGTIKFYVRGLSAGPYWEAVYTIGTL